MWLTMPVARIVVPNVIRSRTIGTTGTSKAQSTGLLFAAAETIYHSVLSAMPEAVHPEQISRPAQEESASEA